MIRIRDLYKVVGGRAVLRGIDLDIGPGEVVAVVGAPGSGKSVLLAHAAGLLYPDRGDVAIKGRSISQCTERERDRVRRTIGLVSAEAGLLDSLTVRENLLLALDGRACERSPIHAADRIAWSLELVQLGSTVLGREPRELSHSTRQRVAVARAMIDSPDVLLFDDPCMQMDPFETAALSKLIIRCHDLLGASSLLVTRDAGFAAGVADRVAFLRQGKLDPVAGPTAGSTSGDAPYPGRTPRTRRGEPCP